MLLVFFLAVLSLGCAGRAPYLGEDMEQLIEATKRSGISTVPHVQKPVTAQQKENSNRFNSKFTDIAKAYAEGYKAAIKAVQVRALIAQKRIQANRLATQINARSSIPSAPAMDDSSLKVPELSGSFDMPVPNEVTVNGMEKSGIPHPGFESSALPASLINEHKVVERSAPFQGTLESEKPKIAGFAETPVEQISEEKRNAIAKMNYAARHRNVYFDLPGGITRQNIIFQKKHRKRRSIVRNRRSHMPYLGQNLDAIGVVRAQINWDEKPHKKHDTPSTPKDEKAVSPQETESLQQQQQQASGIPYAKSNIPVGLYGYPHPYQALQVQAQQRNQVPMYNYNNQLQMQTQPMYPNQNYAGFNFEQTSQQSNVEEQPIAGVERSKKSASPEPDVATLNYAARHRNVYLDSVSGDPYSGGSSVLSRQNILYKKH